MSSGAIERSGSAPLPESDPVSAPSSYALRIIIVNYKTAALTIACLETLEPELREFPAARVIVVENSSGDEGALAQSIADRGWGGWVELDVSDVNGGFSYGNNRAIRPTLSAANPPRYHLLLNSDTEVRPGAIHALVEFMNDHPEVGIAGSSFENPDGSLWPIAFRFITPLSELDRGLRFGPVSRLLGRHVSSRVMEQDRPQQVDWICGACMLIRHEVFVRAGLFDEGYFLYFEEMDFCFQARRSGWPCWYVPKSRVMHIAGQSTKVTRREGRPPRTPPYWFASRRRYFLKNYGLFGALGADLAFGLGSAIWRIRAAISRQPDLDPPHHVTDFWKSSVLLPRNRRLDPPF